MKKYDLVKAASPTRPESERERAKPLLFKIHGDCGKIDREMLLPGTVLEGSATAPDPVGARGHSLGRVGSWASSRFLWILALQGSPSSSPWAKRKGINDLGVWARLSLPSHVPEAEARRKLGLRPG